MDQVKQIVADTLRTMMGATAADPYVRALEKALDAAPPSDSAAIAIVERALPAHAASLHLTHNQHKAYYQPIADYLEDVQDDQFAGVGGRAQCIAADCVWELQWYPDTPVGFHCLYAASLVDLLAALPTVSAK